MRRNMSDLFCGRIAAGEKYNLTHDNLQSLNILLQQAIKDLKKDLGEVA